MLYKICLRLVYVVLAIGMLLCVPGMIGALISVMTGGPIAFIYWLITGDTKKSEIIAMWVLFLIAISLEWVENELEERV